MDRMGGAGIQLLQLEHHEENSEIGRRGTETCTESQEVKYTTCVLVSNVVTHRKPRGENIGKLRQRVQNVRLNASLDRF
jgi:hypothetical protein